MKCPYCNADISRGASFCINCGNRFSRYDKRRIILAILISIVIISSYLALNLFIIIPIISSPPGDVYSRPTPSSNISPESLLPDNVIGRELSSIENETYGFGLYAMGIYQDEFQIQIYKCNSTEAAIALLDDIIRFYKSGRGAQTDYPFTQTVNTSEKHWFAFKESGVSNFGWRNDFWVFVIYSTNDNTRDEILDEVKFY